ncbi:hypothetical protein KM043_010861 [Ampulex compressa]|nr:hypothetical protein KM043_010861 [Ampulex compressa]
MVHKVLLFLLELLLLLLLATLCIADQASLIANENTRRIPFQSRLQIAVNTSWPATLRGATISSIPGFIRRNYTGGRLGRTEGGRHSKSNKPWNSWPDVERKGKLYETAGLTLRGPGPKNRTEVGHGNSRSSGLGVPLRRTYQSSHFHLSGARPCEGLRPAWNRHFAARGCWPMARNIASRSSWVSEERSKGRQPIISARRELLDFRLRGWRVRFQGESADGHAARIEGVKPRFGCRVIVLEGGPGEGEKDGWWVGTGKAEIVGSYAQLIFQTVDEFREKGGKTEA